MPRRRVPKLVQLDPLDLHVTRDVAAFDLEIGYPPGEGLPMRLCFVLSDGVELHAPVSLEIAYKIRDMLNTGLPSDDAEKRGGEE